MSNSKPQLVVSDRHLSVLVTGLMGCHGAVATLLRARGNVVMGPWQRCYGAVATLIWGRGNVVMRPWQRTKRLTRMGKCLQRTGKCRAVSGYGLHDAAANVYGPHSADAVWPVERVYIIRSGG